MKLLKNITQSELFKISSLNSISVLLKIGAGLITSKVLAVFVGPSGIALVGNLRNFITSLEGLATLGFQSGIVKYISEKKEDPQELKKIISTSFICLLLAALILSGGLFYFASYWNYQIFSAHYDFSFVIKALSLALPWYIVSMFFNCVINGLGAFKKVIWISIIGNFIGLLMSLILILNFNTLGALLAIVLAPALVFFVSFYFLHKEISLFQTFQFQFFDSRIIRDLSSYSLMALVPSIFGPMVFLGIRNRIISTLGIDQAGYWESISRISSYYMLFVSTILSVFYFQKLAHAKSNSETKTIFWSYYKNILPLFVLGLVVLYFLRFTIVNLLFTKEFLPVADLFLLQVIGDVLKAAFLILGFQFLAKKLTFEFIFSELASLLVLYFGSVYLIQIYGVQGALLAQLLDNFIYLAVLVVYFRKSLF